MGSGKADVGYMFENFLNKLYRKQIRAMNKLSSTSAAFTGKFFTQDGIMNAKFFLDEIEILCLVLAIV